MEVQRFQFVLWDLAKENGLDPQTRNVFRGVVQIRDKPLFVVIREDGTAPESFHVANGEPGVDAVIKGRFALARLAEIR